jgi:hypothetical protein
MEVRQAITDIMRRDNDDGIKCPPEVRCGNMSVKRQATLLKALYIKDFFILFYISSAINFQMIRV